MVALDSSEEKLNRVLQDLGKALQEMYGVGFACALARIASSTSFSLVPMPVKKQPMILILMS